jgi:hypothetical protein
MGKTCGILLAILAVSASPVRAEPIALTYSYSNLFDGTLHTVLSPAQLRAATEEAFAVWARHAPIYFFEAPDAGPPPSDVDYSPAGVPDVRIGHHDASSYSHAFYPWASGGLARDVHLLTAHTDPFYWSLGDDPSPYAIDFMATMVHEIGHALGLAHYEGEPSIMNTTLIWSYAGLGTAFLFPRDILSIQALYGTGTGAVYPLDDVTATPEPGTLMLLAVPVAALLRRRRAATRSI